MLGATLVAVTGVEAKLDFLASTKLVNPVGAANRSLIVF